MVVSKISSFARGRYIIGPTICFRILAVVIIVTHPSVSACFIPQRQQRYGPFVHRKVHLYNSDRFPVSILTAHNDKVNDRTSDLRFRASIKYNTKPAPVPKDGKTMNDFFATDNYLLLPVGTCNKVFPIKRTRPDIMHRWEEEASQMGTTKPNRIDRVLSLSVRTPFLIFSIDVEATIGVKLFKANPVVDEEGDPSLSNPELEFILLGQKFSADGPPPLVWIFNQMTGIDQKTRKTSQVSNHAVFRVKVLPSNDGKGIVFASNMDAELHIQFPSMLLELLPVAKEVIEEQGSKSLQQLMNRDLPPGVDKFHDAYVKWIKEERFA
eukprot:scaffold58372_cov53-Attheya_sp.AAC.1